MIIRKSYLSLTFLLAFLIFSFSLKAVLPKDFFPEKSELSQGKWVKIGIAETGIYEIPYDSLRQFGFSEPEKVSLVGRGGSQLPLDFLDKSGNKAFSTSLPSVKILHKNNKLIFFGRGPEQIVPEKNSTGEPVYSRKSKNPYSTYGYYFLTDSRDPDLMTTVSVEASGNKSVYSGRAMSYVYHERELRQNTSQSGTLFWGESIDRYSDNKAVAPYRTFDAIPDRDARMECIVYLERGLPGIFSFGPDKGGERACSQLSNPSSQMNFRPIEPSEGIIRLPSGKGDIRVEIESDDRIDICALDYWIISYDRSMPTLRDEKSAVFCLPDVKKGDTVRLDFTNRNSTILALDSRHETPVIISVSETGDRLSAIVKADRDMPEFAVFDSSVSQQNISFAKQVGNQNLYEADADSRMLIITTDSLKNAALRLAAIHQRIDGFNSTVTTVEELYNDFSSGRPDPMAYRCMAKLLYERGNGKLKNILLFGPMLADLLTKDSKAFEHIIAMQWGDVGEGNVSPNINDFYGCMSDFIKEAPYNWNNMIAVGILPAHRIEEAERICDKIEKYLTDTGHLYTLNRFFSSGGTGDNHLHATQARNIARSAKNASGGCLITSVLPNVTYKEGESTPRFVDGLDKCGLACYFGHGNPTVIDSNKKLFASTDMSTLTNINLPFMLFAGCNITNTDRGNRGIGESLILETDKGIIGALMANRNTWANRNYEFMNFFIKGLFGQNQETDNSDPKTFGEIYVASKIQSKSENELSYSLYCDPSLRIVYPRHRLCPDMSDACLETGKKIQIKGSVKNSDDKHLADYNGEVYAAIYAPEKLLTAQNISTSDKAIFTYSKEDELLVSAKGSVKNGGFCVSFEIPNNIVTSDSLTLTLSAYDPASRAGAAYRAELPVKRNGNDPSAGTGLDTTAPEIEIMEYSGNNGILQVKATDDRSLDMRENGFSEGLILRIDGKEYAPARTAAKIPVNDETAYISEIPLPSFSAGYHTLVLTIADAAGNKNSRELRILAGEKESGLQISAEKRIFHTEAEFSQTGEKTASEFILYITALNGETIAAEKKRGDRFTWDLKDFEGKRVKSGIYRAHIVTEGGSDDHDWSALIEFIVSDK